VGKPVSKYDGRLIGAWRSDRRRTFRHFKPKPGCPPRSLRKLKSIFGKLVIRWSRGRYYTELDGYHDSGAYAVVAQDESSIVVRFWDSLTEADRIGHIHFEGDHYWTAVSGGLIEWFRRVE
jgi:hypothetical protein